MIIELNWVNEYECLSVEFGKIIISNVWGEAMVCRISKFGVRGGCCILVELLFSFSNWPKRSQYFNRLRPFCNPKIPPGSLKWSQIGVITFYKLNTLQLQNIKINNAYHFKIVQFSFFFIEYIGLYDRLIY